MVPVDLPINPFPREEFVHRLDRAQSTMADLGQDALLVTTEPNVAYFAGLRAPSFRSNTRPIAVIVPAVGEPVLVCSQSQVPNVREQIWFEAIEPFAGFEEDAVTTLAHSIRRLPNAARIGVELGREQRIGLTLGAFRALAERVAPVSFVDAAPLIWSLRSRKSAAEIAVMRAASDANTYAMSRALSAARPGMREVDVYREWARGLLDAGADQPGYMAMHSGSSRYRVVSGGATDRELAPGDLVWMDGGPIYRGYWSDLTRIVAIGEPTADQSRLYAFAWQAVREVLDAVRPGSTLADLVRRCEEFFADAGFRVGSASRIGHGVGLELTEPPSIVSSEQTELQPGCVLAIEPALARDDGYFVLEENFVVTEAGVAELISPPAPPTIPILEL